MEIGSLADWVSGLASVFAAGTALYFWGKDRKDSQEAALTDVAMWAQKIDDSAQDGWVLRAMNNTKAPIWNWYLEIRWSENGEEHSELVTSSDAGLLPPGHSSFRWIPSSPASAETSLFVRFGFQDSNGQCWIRRTSSRLKKTKSINFE